MRYAFLISLLLLTTLCGFLARRSADTSAELLPVVSAIEWVETGNRAIPPEMIPAGVQPANSMRIGKSLLPRTPPIIAIQNFLIVKIYRDLSGHKIADNDLPSLIWLYNVLGIVPWALFLFLGIRRFSEFLRTDSDGNTSSSIEISWAAISGAMVFGWLGSSGIYLPMTALAVWSILLLIEAFRKFSFAKFLVAGLCAGFAGSLHPSMWAIIILGIFSLSIDPDENGKGNLTKSIIAFGLGGLAAAGLSLVSNAIFYGTIAPVQFIKPVLIKHDIFELMRLIWHDTVGLNGIVWLCPLFLSGIFAMGGKGISIKLSQAMKLFLVLFSAVILFWGIADSARTESENRSINENFRMIPVELVDGNFTIVNLSGASGGIDEAKAYFELLHSRTDVFFSLGGRPAGIPLAVPMLLIFSVMGLVGMRSGTFGSGFNWAAIRIGGFWGLIMSQAPWGTSAEAFIYTGRVVGQGNIPIMEALLSVSIRLAELWPSGIITF